MADYTPATPQVRAAYIRAMRNTSIGSAAEHEAEFDRWLAVNDTRIIELETERDNAIRLAEHNHAAYLDAIGAQIR